MQRTAALVYCVFFLLLLLQGNGRFPCHPSFLADGPASIPLLHGLGTPPYPHSAISSARSSRTLSPHTKKEFKRKHIYNIISQSITLVCPVANCLRKGSIILFLDPLYIFCHTSNCTCSFSFPFFFLTFHFFPCPLLEYTQYKKESKENYSHFFLRLTVGLSRWIKKRAAGKNELRKVWWLLRSCTFW